jgi:hypothetical protein
MQSIRVLTVLALLVPAMTLPAQAATGPSIHGGGSASDMTRFALAIDNGVGHFECLMPSMMTVEATVTSVDSASATTATFHGVAQVTLAVNNPFGLPSGPMASGVSFTATVQAGGPESGEVNLVIMGMPFNGTVVHGFVSVGP